MPDTAPFDAVASEYDTAFTTTETGRLQRAIVHQFLAQHLSSASKILELNCGTGADAVWLANSGHHILATDISSGMLTVLQQKIQKNGLAEKIKSALVDAGTLNTSLDNAGYKGVMFDLIFSNFGGLNCLSPEALARLSGDLKGYSPPGGQIILVLMGRFCWWESLYFLLKGRWANVLRRLSRQPIAAKLDHHTYIDTWYYSPAEVSRVFSAWKTVQIAPVGVWLPPSYLDTLVCRWWPAGLSFLNRLERLCRAAFWANISDHYLIRLENTLD